MWAPANVKIRHLLLALPGRLGHRLALGDQPALPGVLTPEPASLESAFVSISSVWGTRSKRHQRANLRCLLNKRMGLFWGRWNVGGASLLLSSHWPDDRLHPRTDLQASGGGANRDGQAGRWPGGDSLEGDVDPSRWPSCLVWQTGPGQFSCSSSKTLTSDGGSNTGQTSTPDGGGVFSFPE